VGGGLIVLLAQLLAASSGEAQSSRNWNRSGPPPGAYVAPPYHSAQGGPAIRGTQQLPNYYLVRQGPVAAPKGPVPPGDVATSLRARGFRDIGPVQQRGNTSIVPQATGPSGEKVQLVIGPNGEIVGVRVLGPGGR
jgi:hypothetical protein